MQSDGTEHPAELWAADLCAIYRGVTEEEWDRHVFAGREPLPFVNDGVVRLWDAHTVRTWRHHGLVHEGEWLAPRCAAHHGVTLDEWRRLVQQGRAPSPKRKAGSHWVWDVRKVQQPLKPKPEPSQQSLKRNPEPSQRPARQPRPVRPYRGPDPKRPWTAADCAAYLGIPPRLWRAMVRNGDAPPPSGVEGVKTPVWAPDDVMKLDNGTAEGSA